MARVVDLDVLRPEQVIVKLGGNDIDVTIMPLALTFDVSDLLTKSAALDQKKLTANDPKEVQKAFDLTVDMCVLFCEHQFPDMNRDYFTSKVTVAEINALGTEIRDALTRAYGGIDPKNSETVEATADL